MGEGVSDAGFGLSKRVSRFSHGEKLSAELTDEGVGSFRSGYLLSRCPLRVAFGGFAELLQLNAWSIIKFNNHTHASANRRHKLP